MPGSGSVLPIKTVAFIDRFRVENGISESVAGIVVSARGTDKPML